jgi:phosphoglucosamine mutase
MAKLFGTDGIRGIAHEPPLDRVTVSRVGRALARNLGAPSPRVLIGRDTRRSGPELERYLVNGLESGGASSECAGVITTPAVAFLTRSEGFDAGVVISASHNPFRDNGIKIFTASGSKSSEELETRIEREVEEAHEIPDADAEAAPEDLRFEELYLDHLLSTLSDVPRLGRLEMVLDCANGAGYRVGPRLLRELGLVVHPICAEPDGENINRSCGSTDIERLRASVLERGCHLGAALDGDGDRVLLVDSKGRVVDGDAILLLCARRLRKEGRLSASAVVATVMSNLALELALVEEGMKLYRAPVGDKYVSQEMSERNIMLGGEQSGHVIFSEYGPSGDGLLTLLQVLRVMALEEKTIDELGRLDPFPQILVNVRVREKPEVRTVPRIAEAVADAEARLGSRGRVLVRYSGTEPLLRIMMEGPEREEIESLAREVKEAVMESIGEESSS